jgi:hypothetical protein
MTEEQKPELVRKEEKSTKSGKIKWFLVIFAGLFWLILIGLKLSTDISLFPFLLITIGVTIIAVFSFFAKAIADKFKEKAEKIKDNPEPLNQDQVILLLHQAVEDVKWDHIKKPDGIRSVQTRTINGNQIYCFLVDLVYNEPHYVIINATYPNTKPTFAPESVTKNPTLEKLINSKSQNPNQEPDMEISEETVDNFGRPARKVQRIIQKAKEDKKEEAII